MLMGSHRPGLHPSPPEGQAECSYFPWGPLDPWVVQRLTASYSHLVGAGALTGAGTGFCRQHLPRIQRIVRIPHFTEGETEALGG